MLVRSSAPSVCLPASSVCLFVSLSLSLSLSLSPSLSPSFFSRGVCVSVSVSVCLSVSLSFFLSPGLWCRGFTPYTARSCAPDSCGGQWVACSHGNRVPKKEAASLGNRIHCTSNAGSQEISPEPVLLIVRYSSISWFVVYKFFLLSFTLGSTQEPGGGKTLCLSVSLSLLCSGALCLSVCVYAYAWVNVRVFPSPLFVPLCQCMHACMCVRV